MAAVPGGDRSASGPATVNAVAVWHQAPFFSERERPALLVTDAITLLADSHVPREIYDEARAHFDDKEFARLVGAIVAINA
jgi:alkylhydroperoxidase family enzyme